jgi:ribosome-binding ATPase
VALSIGIVGLPNVGKSTFIHSDFQRGFIKAEVVTFADYDRYGGEAGAKAVGKLRVEGRDYVMQDGDVVHFRFNV